MAYRSQKAYHVTLGDRRTTVSMDNILSDLLALKLGVEPDAPEAQGAVRGWLQAQLDTSDDPGRIRVSQWLRRQAIEAVIDGKLASAYAAHMDRIISIDTKR